LQYIMNCSAQVKVMLTSALASSMAWPISEDIWVLLSALLVKSVSRKGSIHCYKTRVSLL
jgi:hypothetical protein